LAPIHPPLVASSVLQRPSPPLPSHTLRASQTLASTVTGTSSSVPRHDRTPTYWVTTSLVSYGQGTPGLPSLVPCHRRAHCSYGGHEASCVAAKRQPHRERRVLAAATGRGHAESGGLYLGLVSVLHAIIDGVLSG
jgi:hypothetical protein